MERTDTSLRKRKLGTSPRDLCIIWGCDLHKTLLVGATSCCTPEERYHADAISTRLLIKPGADYVWLAGSRGPAVLVDVMDLLLRWNRTRLEPGSARSSRGSGQKENCSVTVFGVADERIVRDVVIALQSGVNGATTPLDGHHTAALGDFGAVTGSTMARAAKRRSKPRCVGARHLT